MKLSALLEVIVNYKNLYIYVWDTNEKLFEGLNREADENLMALYDKKVLILESRGTIFEIGVK